MAQPCNIVAGVRSWSRMLPTAVRCTSAVNLTSGNLSTTYCQYTRQSQIKGDLYVSALHNMFRASHTYGLLRCKDKITRCNITAHNKSSRAANTASVAARVGQSLEQSSAETAPHSLCTHRLSADLVGDAFGEEEGEESRWDITFIALCSPSARGVCCGWGGEKKNTPTFCGSVGATASVSTCGVFSHLEPPESYFAPPPCLFERKCLFSAIAMEAKWTPSSPEERAYYDRLFALADVSNSGKLGGDAVVPFLAKSGLGFGILKEVRKRELRFCSRATMVYFLFLFVISQASTIIMYVVSLAMRL